MYNCYMDLKAKELVKVLLSEQGVKQKELAQMLSERTGKPYTPGSLSQKTSRGTISYNEVRLIADILGYEIVVQRKQ